MTTSKHRIFICYNRQDTAAVDQIVSWLGQAGAAEIFIDRYSIEPGKAWQQQLEDGISKSTACAVFVGPGGISTWQREEIQTAIAKKNSDAHGNYRVVPILLPESTRGDYSTAPAFLKNNQWVDLHLGLEDPAAREQLVWLLTGQRPRLPIPDPSTLFESPYRGLKSFEEKHAPVFFGREALLDWLLYDLKQKTPWEPPSRFLAIVGPSGSGKSSLVRAGLAHSLRTDGLTGSRHWPLVIMRPGTNPVEHLVLAIAPEFCKDRTARALDQLEADILESQKALHYHVKMLFGDRPDQRFVIIVDQFEELFTHCADEKWRKAFLDNLLHASLAPDGALVVLLTLRADFYGKAAFYPELAAALCSHNHLVGPMTREQLHRAIVHPAELFHGECEEALVETLLNDLEHQPGALPLLEDMLFDLWQGRDDANRMTLDKYVEMGRIDGALKRRAEKVYSLFSTKERETCRKILLRLSRPGEGTEDTRSQAAVEDLLSLEPDANQIEKVLSALASPEARLITMESKATSETQRLVEISHEALLRAWPRLNHWVTAEGEHRRMRDRLNEAARDWEASQFNSGYLFRGPRLAQYIEWAAKVAEPLSSLATKFLQESQDFDEQTQGFTDSSVLDQLISSAPSIWHDDTQRGEWLNRADILVAGLGRHKEHLQRIDVRLQQRPDAADLVTQKQTLAVLVSRLENADSGLFAAARHLQHTWPRLESIVGKEFTAAWQMAIESISERTRSPQYDGLQIVPQQGLVPLRQDARSGLWEFLHLLTGIAPAQDADGEYRIGDLTGVVVVLIPAKTFYMGSSTRWCDTSGAGFVPDPYARPEESPIHTVTLKPFFISKYPMTQGQWLRAAGFNPSFWTEKKTTPGTNLRNPVDCVTWLEASAMLQAVGLQLPTEAQWECAARGGTRTNWWIGNDPVMLNGKANLKDTRDPVFPHPRTCPVDHYRFPNHFGLYDVIGNVWEWCRDPFSLYTTAPREGDGFRGVEGVGDPVCRGGSFFNTTDFGRSSVRYFHTPRESRYNNLGIRPSLSLVGCRAS